MKFIDLIAKIVFGNYCSDGFYKPEKMVSKDSYSLTSIFPNATIEKQVLKFK